ncbi:DUF2169 domain-containing protein [Myxococcus sp. CA040A]|uniref:DUF2169 family type VI secretion system accessory protein n=1 Tax=Myxococcus sp. CA040A TaxID=2741738 RepID=UPI00157B1338|nr:DUF2169 domain-containing protein [Myxococcus sp. CA040A]NTX05824.1 DUF2169 domain-containing protein [Myxococcus sp. CA040A]
MWALINETPYKAEATAVIDKMGERHWTVVAKGTFNINDDGSVRLAKEQVAPLLTPEYRGTPGQSSLLYDADMTPSKPGTDIILNASAYVSGGTSATEAPVAVRALTRNRLLFDKRLLVHGERRYRRVFGQVRPSSPAPFRSLPIVYERAYGGFDDTDPEGRRQKLFPSNPIGTGMAARSEHLVDKPVHNVEYLGGHTKTTAGLGAICSYWSPRRELAGSYDDTWTRSRKPLLPWDHDERHHLCAPADQQLMPHPPMDLRFELVNLTPKGLLRLALPLVYLAFTTRFARYRNKAPVEHRARLHTVIIEPDKAKLILVWHTSLACHHDIDDIDATVIREKERV